MEFLVGRKDTVILVEPESFEGVKRIAGRLAEDIEKVTGIKPEVVTRLREEHRQVILCATLGKSAMTDIFVRDQVIHRAALEGKREVYQIRLTEADGRRVLAICGSDKRGTIYGIFALSEYLGVSPLCFWGDVSPVRREDAAVGTDIEVISKEPSVRYRGFFINDEWPCFGTWATSHFGDFNTDCYEHVFELLLRLKGNYLWPAMWTASFPLDGPGSANEELADLYGVVMGYSHHEPCLRASEEWDKVRGEGSKYGNAWNFYTNEQGLLHYWEDALKRSGKYENVITIGMRGERDSSMLGEEATLEENIGLLKRIITAQRDLIRTNVNSDIDRVPQLLALYKEVERYFYGDGSTEGLKDWKELENVTFMLCEDNFGHMRTLPPSDMREHPGGWGMYFHFDYHGAPVSYEWVDSTPLSQTWEQMTEAYEYGIRDVWIVNVGDLKFHEVPLSYFLSLAYDFDKWGSKNVNSPREYLEQWVGKTFPLASGEQQCEIGGVFTDYIRMNSLRRPEALHAGVYHPCHYEETDRMLALAEQIEERSGRLLAELPAQERDAYYSMIHFPAAASANLLKMHLYAGKNQHYAAQGKVAANRYACLAEACMERDHALAEEFGAFREGKWDGMQLEQHIGFTKWNEDDCRNPVLCKVTPIYKPAMKVSRRDEIPVATKKYGPPEVISVDDFLFAGCEQVVLEIANGGIGSFCYQIEMSTGEKLPEWLTVSPQSGEVSEQEEVTLACTRELLPAGTQKARLHITDGDTCVAVEIAARRVEMERLPAMTFVERRGVISMLAEHYCEKADAEGGAFVRIPDYGKYGSGMKVMPSMAHFQVQEEKPALAYSFVIEEAGEYQVDILTAPSNPESIGKSVNILLETAGERRVLELIPEDFRAGESCDGRWAQGVLNQIHRAGARLFFEKGIQRLTIGALDAGVVLEKIMIYAPERPCKESYLGPEESSYRPTEIQRSYPNLFAEIGKSEGDIEKRLEEIRQFFFYGNEDERVYYPVEDDMAYILDTGNRDVRTEGMSYGMMLCVQLDRKEEFDRLWKWAKTYMWMESGENEGYFAWSCGIDGTHNSDGPAPDGEEYFAMALFFASHRWGEGEGIFGYAGEARKILEACLHKGQMGRAGAPMWNRENHQILFVPGADFTDPSYHLPHFYELFALWANREDREFWAQAAQASRAYLAGTCHCVTGLSAEYAEFDGSPMSRKLPWTENRHDWFYSDAYRTAANIGLDYAWFGKDAGQRAAADRIQAFLLQDGREGRYAIYETDGRPAGEKVLHPVAITAATAQASLAAENDRKYEWVERFWKLPMRTGERRYYDNCLYFFAFLALSGRYRIW